MGRYQNEQAAGIREALRACAAIYGITTIEMMAICTAAASRFPSIERLSAAIIADFGEMNKEFPIVVDYDINLLKPSIDALISRGLLQVASADTIQGNC